VGVFIFLCLFSLFSNFSFFDLKTSLALLTIFLITIIFIGIRQVVDERKFLTIIEKMKIVGKIRKRKIKRF
jgi:hypothetical protein